MRFSTATLSGALIALLNSNSCHAFVPSHLPSTSTFTTNTLLPTLSSSTARLMSSNEGDAKRLQEILAEEASNPKNLAETAERMKNLSPSDLSMMISQIESMPESQKEVFSKQMGMDLNMMVNSMKVMRDNPSIRKSAQQMMEQMSPEELMKQSRLSQEQMKNMSADQIDQAAEVVKNMSSEEVDQIASTMSQVMSDDLKASSDPNEPMDAVIINETDNSSSSSPSVSDVPLEGSAQDPSVLDTMYKVAEYMSLPPSGKVTFKAFSSLPIITTLSGPAENDLSPRELKECWEDGSLGATRVDRVGFERVWAEVCEYFEGDIMEEARKTLAKKKATGAATRVTSTAVTPSASTTTAAPASASPQVGANLSSDQMKSVNEQVKNMSDNDVSGMLDQMSNMTPEQEARMKMMGVDVEMMKKASGMMKDNPMMRKAAQAMMKNMSSEQMLKMSQQAQEKLSNMSPEEKKKAMEEMDKL